MSYNPFDIVKTFEREVAKYTGAPYAVAVNNCTNALFLCCEYLKVDQVHIPSETFISVPNAIIQAGGRVVFDKTRNHWRGAYLLWPYPIYDAAKRFTSGMYMEGMFMCLSFHHKKHLKIGRGGMILTDDPVAVEWFKKRRYLGRGEKLVNDETDITSLGYMMYMYPQEAAQGLLLMQSMVTYNEDLVEKDGYRDLTELSVFKNCKVNG